MASAENTPLRNTEIQFSNKAEVTDRWLQAQTTTTDPDGYDKIKEESNHPWVNLPESVMGTLVYFMMVEQNAPHFDTIAFFKAYLVIGFPTILCYFFQIVMIRGLYLAVYGDNAQQNIISDFICEIDSCLLFSAIGVYFISMIPACEEWLNLSDIILHSQRVAYTQEASDDKNPKVYVTNLLAPWSRRLIVFCLVNLLEGFIILALSFTGVGFLLSSDDVQDVLMNSVAIAFITDIDDMARDAYQTDEIDEQIDAMEFELPSFTSVKEIENNMSSKGIIRTPGVSVYRTFSFAKQAILTIVIAFLATYLPVSHYCGF